MIDTAKFREESKALNKRIGEMRKAMYDEMFNYLQQHGAMRFDAVQDPHNDDCWVKGYRIGKDYKGDEVIQLLLEKKAKAAIWINNPYGTWYNLAQGWGFATIRIMSDYYDIFAAHALHLNK